MKMRTTILTSLGLSALLAVGVAAAHGHPGGKHKHHHARHEAQAALNISKISAKEAIAKAENDSGARADNLELDMHRGNAVFEIDLFDDKQEYEIRIDAQSGDIISRHSEYEDSLPRPTNISLAQAVEIAEREIGGKVVDAEREGRSSGIIYEIKLIKEDGSRHYIHIHSEDGHIIDSGTRQSSRGMRGEGMHDGKSKPKS